MAVNSRPLLLPFPRDQLVRLSVNPRVRSFPATIRETSSYPNRQLCHRGSHNEDDHGCKTKYASRPLSARRPRPGMIILNVRTFDDPTVARPGREILRDGGLPWTEVHGEILAVRKTTRLKTDCADADTLESELRPTRSIQWEKSTAQWMALLSSATICGNPSEKLIEYA